MQVADILARTPPLPLAIDHCSHRGITAQEKEDLLLALQHRDRVRAIRLRMRVSDLKTLIVAMGGEFPILECLTITPPIASTFPASLILPAAFHAPRLRRLKLSNFATQAPIMVPPSPSLAAPTGLVKLSLFWNHLPTYPCPGTLLQLLSESSVPRLEMLQISFDTTIFDHGFDSDLDWLHARTMTRVTFPNLHRFTFEGDRSYLEAFLPWIQSPLLEKLHISFFYDPMFSVPHLLSFLGTIENLEFVNIKLTVCVWYISVQVYHRRGVGGDLSLFYRDSRTFPRKMAAAARIVNSLGTLLSSVEHLTLQCETAFELMGLGVEHDRTQWCSLLRPFGNVKTLLVDEGWTGEMSRFLPFGRGGPPMDLLPELKELIYCTYQDIVVDAFTKFTAARREAGHPVTLVRHQSSCGW